MNAPTLEQARELAEVAKVLRNGRWAKIGRAIDAAITERDSLRAELAEAKAALLAKPESPSCPK